MIQQRKRYKDTQANQNQWRLVIIARVLFYEGQEIMITGLDISSAFDTINRAELSSTLKGIF